MTMRGLNDALAFGAAAIFLIRSQRRRLFSRHVAVADRGVPATTTIDIQTQPTAFRCHTCPSGTLALGGDHGRLSRYYYGPSYSAGVAGHFAYDLLCPDCDRDVIAARTQKAVTSYLLHNSDGVSYRKTPEATPSEVRRFEEVRR